ncbi:MAG: YdcF family protein, partial [Acidobacteriota bacterium]
RLAIEHGVPAQAIVLEEHAKTTRENTRYTAAICRARGWTRVIAVSDPYHLWRVRRGFAREGISAATSPARECERNRRLLSRARWTAREVLAIARDLVEDLLRRRARAAQGQPRP